MNITKIESTIYKDTHFTIEHVLDYAIPGYLILYFNDRNSFKNQHRVTLTTLGILLSQIVNCINATIQPKKIYCLMFGEKEERPHFHLFPRTQAITDAYYKATRIKEEIISGPELLTWVFKNKKGLCPELPDIVDRLQKKLHQLIMKKIT